jgi:putative ABC transport system permease protein
MPPTTSSGRTTRAPLDAGHSAGAASSLRRHLASAAMTLSLALRNLLRNRRRSLATLLALAIGAASVLIFGGFVADIRLGMVTGFVQNSGHFQVQHKDFYLYGSGNPTGYGISQYARIAEAIRRDPELKDSVTVVSPMLQFGGVAGNYDAGVSRTVVGVGYVAGDVSRMREWNEFSLPPIARPNRLDGAAEDAAVVGIGLARVLLLCEPLRVSNCPKPETASAGAGPALPDDIAALAAGEQGASERAPGTRIELLAGQARGAPNVAALNVVAAEDQGFKEFDEITVLLQFEQAQKLVYGRAEPQATALMVQLHRTADLPWAMERTRALLADVVPGAPLAVLDFATLNPYYTQTVQLFDTIFGFIFVLIGGIVLFTVSNTMTAAVVERTAEIGTVRAVGLRQGGVRRLFLAEGVLLGCVGAITGAVAALVISGIVNRLGLEWLPPASSTTLPLTIRVWGEPGMIIGSTLGLVAVAALSAWWPAWRAARLNIVDALRHA